MPLQDTYGQLFFKVGKAVIGDVVVALYTDNSKTDSEPPLLAYALHTAFLRGDDVVHANAKKLDFPHNPSLSTSVLDGLHLDIMLAEQPAEPG